ncbi:hypothetical protein [Spirosoma flavum]|uniref:Bacteriocin n=1 Tax=Spirosoma flavum TaxID=2048557 RepID=A0ABW6AKX5_9BACT
MENYSIELTPLSDQDLIEYQGGVDLSGLGDWITNTLDNIHTYGKNLGRQIGEAIW